MTMQPSQQCPGKRLLDTYLVGICLCCGRQDDKAKSTTTPPAVKDDGGKWSCVDLVPPLGWPRSMR